MLRLIQEIEIGENKLPFIATCEIYSSRNNFTDTARITIPNKIPSKGEKISDIIKKGDAVTIKLGYFQYNLFTEFTGYVSQVIPEKTATIICENEAYKAKRTSIGKDLILKNTDLETLLKNIWTGDYIVNNSNIGDISVSKNSTVIDVLSFIQSKYKIFSYFRGKTLIVGPKADTHISNYIPCNFQDNVPTGESSFNFKDADADKVVVKVTNINRQGTINTIYAYYDNDTIVYSKTAPGIGAVNEFNIGGQTDFSEIDLKSLATIRLEALSYTGCDGTITIYGYPPASHGDIAVVSDTEIPEKNGNYAVMEVTKRFGYGIGFRQDLALGLFLGTGLGYTTDFTTGATS